MQRRVQRTPTRLQKARCLRRSYRGSCTRERLRGEPRRPRRQAGRSRARRGESTSSRGCCTPKAGERPSMELVGRFDDRILRDLSPAGRCDHEVYPDTWPRGCDDRKKHRAPSRRGCCDHGKHRAIRRRIGCDPGAYRDLRPRGGCDPGVCPDTRHRGCCDYQEVKTPVRVVSERGKLPCGPRGTRTLDRRIKSPQLYRLSYWPDRSRCGRLVVHLGRNVNRILRCTPRFPTSPAPKPFNQGSRKARAARLRHGVAFAALTL